MTSGIFLSKKISSFAVIKHISNATIIPPWKPTKSTPKPNIWRVVTSTVPCAAAYASARLGESIIQPITIPKIGRPPNLLTAL